MGLQDRGEGGDALLRPQRCGKTVSGPEQNYTVPLINYPKPERRY